MLFEHYLSRSYLFVSLRTFTRSEYALSSLFLLSGSCIVALFDHNRVKLLFAYKFFNVYCVCRSELNLVQILLFKGYILIFCNLVTLFYFRIGYFSTGTGEEYALPSFVFAFSRHPSVFVLLHRYRHVLNL